MRENFCIDCGKEISGSSKVNNRPKRCNSCTRKVLHKKGVYEDLNPNPDKHKELQFNTTSRERAYIRLHDDHWFDYWCGENFRKGKEIHHLWENGGFCLVIPTEEHHRIHNGRGNYNERK